MTTDQSKQAIALHVGKQTVSVACPMDKLEFKIFLGALLKVTTIIHLPIYCVQPVEWMHYNIFCIHPERLKETLALYNDILPPIIAILYSKKCPYKF